MRPVLLAVLIVTAACGSAPTDMAGVRVGETVGFTMYTHCGVESANINGQMWNVVEPLYATPEELGPPAGWDNPEQNGELTLESPDRAVFEAVGQRVVLEPSASSESVRVCD